MKKNILILLGLVIVVGAVFYFLFKDQVVQPTNVAVSGSNAPVNQSGNVSSAPSSRKTAPSPTNVPASGPYVHQLFSASSQDGLSWTIDETMVVDHASVPDIFMRTDGKLGLVYVDALMRWSDGAEGIGCAISADDGETWSVEVCQITGWENLRAADPSMVVLPDGRYRLYSYISEPDENINSTGDHVIRSAISVDGLNFTDEGVVLTYAGLVDPDVFWNGSEWVMFVTSISDENKLIVATSDDGLSFEYKSDSPLDSLYIPAQPFLLSDGQLRVFAFESIGSQNFLSFTSQDGFTWTKEDGVRLTAPSGKRITDPQVVQLSDGSWKMVFKTENTIKKN